MTTDRELMQQALEALEKCRYRSLADEIVDPAITALRERLEQPEQEPVSIRAVAKQAGINLPETYISTMDDAIAAGDSVLMDEQAALLRECRAALDSLIAQKPTIAGLVCGSTTLGNLKAELSAYRPQGVFGSCPQAREQPEQEPVQFKCTVIDDAHPNGIPLEQWAKPPQREWVDLTPKEIEACRQEGYLHSGLNAPFDFDRAAGAVLAKAKEKNT